MTISHSGNNPSSAEIPEIILLDQRGREHHGTIGSRCWGVCVDYGMPSRRTDLGKELVIQGNETISFSTRGHHNPERYQVTIFSGDKIILNTSIEHKIKLDLQNGRYFLNIMAQWSGEGDVSYVFRIQIL
jgi:hypothetical protein